MGLINTRLGNPPLKKDNNMQIWKYDLGDGLIIYGNMLEMKELREEISSAVFISPHFFIIQDLGDQVNFELSHKMSFEDMPAGVKDDNASDIHKKWQNWFFAHTELKKYLLDSANYYNSEWDRRGEYETSK